MHNMCRVKWNVTPFGNLTCNSIEMANSTMYQSFSSLESHGFSISIFAYSRDSGSSQLLRIWLARRMGHTERILLREESSGLLYLWVRRRSQSMGSLWYLVRLKGGEVSESSGKSLGIWAPQTMDMFSPPVMWGLLGFMSALLLFAPRPSRPPPPPPSSATSTASACKR